MTHTEDLHPQRTGSREAIVQAAEHLFLKHGFDGVSMDQLAAEAGVARRTLYNQFKSKEEIFREMLLHLSNRIGHFLPPGIESHDDVEQALHRIANAILTFQEAPVFVGLHKMAISDSRQFPWIADAFTAILDPYFERLVQYFADLTKTGVLNCPYPTLAAHQFLGLLNEPVLWQKMFDRDVAPVSADIVAADAVQMFLLKYRTR
jgi:TetR/AcrR family transcriptional regulator of autoinduction and epiphytic fitness